MPTTRPFLPADASAIARPFKKEIRNGSGGHGGALALSFIRNEGHGKCQQDTMDECPSKEYLVVVARKDSDGDGPRLAGHEI